MKYKNINFVFLKTYFFICNPFNHKESFDKYLWLKKQTKEVDNNSPNLLTNFSIGDTVSIRRKNIKGIIKKKNFNSLWPYSNSYMDYYILIPNKNKLERIGFSSTEWIYSEASSYRELLIEKHGL